MSKIQRNSVIEKCGECNSYCYDGVDKKKETIHCARNAFKTVDRNTIDKDCPLQSCEVYNNISPNITLLDNGFAVKTKTQWENIEKVIVVLKSSHGKE